MSETKSVEPTRSTQMGVRVWGLPRLRVEHWVVARHRTDRIWHHLWGFKVWGFKVFVGWNWKNAESNGGKPVDPDN